MFVNPLFLTWKKEKAQHSEAPRASAQGILAEASEIAPKSIIWC
jgi:hypothetical protein